MRKLEELPGRELFEYLEEGERRRLALALHDGPQQSIAGIGLIVQAAHDAIRAGDAVMVKGSLGSKMAPIVKAIERQFPRQAAFEQAQS